MAYPYNNYGAYNPYMYQQQYQQPQYQQQNMYQQPMQPQYQMPTQNNTFQPTFVSGIEGAKAYILMPNQSIWLKDSDNENILYIKSANQEGKCTLNAYNMQAISLDNVGKKQDMQSNQPTNNLDYITKSEFNAFLGTFNMSMNNLSSLIENALNKPINSQKQANNKRSE